ncbi:MAG: response regulator [Rhodospirillales bacterium]|nr:response regulator [Rhodospirillales bacterium]
MDENRFHQAQSDGGDPKSDAPTAGDIPAGALALIRRAQATLFEDSPFAIGIVDLQGNVVCCNPPYVELFSRDRAYLTGRPLAEAFAAEDRDDVLAQCAKVIMGTARRASLETARLAGEGQGERTIALFATAIEIDGEIGGVTIHALDTTSRRMLDVRFAHAQKLQALGQLAGSVAHDFNNLIAAILGFCDLMLSHQDLPDGHYDDLSQIRVNALRARDLVRQLLAFARKQPLRPVPMSIDDAIDALVPMLRRLLDPNIAIRAEHGAGVPLVSMDPGQLDQVLVNLAVNARDAMPSGGVLTLRSLSVVLAEAVQRASETIAAGRYALIEVADSGDGIAREIIDDIFQPFFTTKPAGAGTGLGLATVYGIVRQSGGYIVVESALGAGACFRIYLPASTEASQVADPATAGETATSLAADAACRGDGAELDADERCQGGDVTPLPEVKPQRRTVLLVDDEDAIRNFAARALRNRGFEVMEAADGESAMQIIADAARELDVLLTDLILPGTDGRTLATEALRARPSIKVIVASAHFADEVQDFAVGEERLSVLSKPFTLAELTARVKRVVGD